jgi:hypothetical protein
VTLAELAGSAEFIVIPEGQAAQAQKIAPEGEIFATRDFADPVVLDAIVAALAAPKAGVSSLR